MKDWKTLVVGDYLHWSQEEADVLIVGDLAGVEARVLALLEDMACVTSLYECVGTAGYGDWLTFGMRETLSFRLLYEGLVSPEYKGVDDEPIPLSQRKGGGLVHGPVQKRGKGKYKKFS